MKKHRWKHLKGTIWGITEKHIITDLETRFRGDRKTWDRKDFFGSFGKIRVIESNGY